MRNGPKTTHFKKKIMETILVFALVGCLFSAAVTYVVLDYRRYGERQAALENVLSAQAEGLKTKRDLQGYTRYLECLSAVKRAATEKMKSLVVKLEREHVHLERFKLDPLKPKAEVTVIVKYAVEYTFGFEARADSFDIVGTTTGVEIRIGRPALTTAPFVKNHSFEIPNGAEVINEKAIFTKISSLLPGLVQQHGVVIESEPATRALCEKKLLEFVGSHLAGQSGVTQVPTISVAYK